MLLQLEELGKAVDAAEKNAARFNLTQADLASRRRWIMETNREVSVIVASAPALSKPSLTENQALHCCTPPTPGFLSRDMFYAGIYLKLVAHPTAHAGGCAGG